MYQSKPWDRGNWNKGLVCIEFVSWQQTLGFEGWFTLGNTIRIESLVTHWYLFCKVTHHYSRSIWIELGQQILLCSLFFSFVVFYFYLYLIVIHFDIGCLIKLVPHIKLLLVWFFIEFTTTIIRNTIFISCWTLNNQGTFSFRNS